MTARGAAGRCPSSTWMGSRLLLVCLLVSRSVAEVSEHCSHMIGNGHLQILQQLIDSQMETACLIEYKFVDQEQLDDPVCYLKKAFVLVQVIIEETMRFKDNTPNANATERLQELSMKLNSCFIKDYKEQNEHSLDRRHSVDPEDILGTRNSPSHPYSEACVQTYKESPLRLLEKIKNFFNETKNFLEKDWNIFSKNCNDSFAKCSSRGSSIQDPQTSAFVFWVLGIILVLLAVGGLLFYSWKRRSHRDPRTLDSSVGRPEGSSLAQDEDRQVELPV
ncbi:macrophage colony-stimulating factor 1 isoform X7 [Rattus norvegicus]|uniref:macrophage colony-stimulating factor 1 isoform X7 n=1 Tax=Rattus norvegicus TaxID=10116 RepID=UPI0003D0C5A6|nr:macrophage colony-stimulating factor 1 isoform X6 [Rattus norvegicus]